VKIRIIPSPNPEQGKPLASAEVEITDGILEGFTLVGFAVWENARGQRSVSFPSKAYVNRSGEKKSFAVLKAVSGKTQWLSEEILRAYAEQETKDAQ
jgi:hypothetical protein